MRAKFLDLARELAEFNVWIRLHYVYPYPHVDEVIPLMADGRVLPYLDVPFQHASPAVLKRMRRPAAQEKDPSPYCSLARDLPEPDHPFDLHRGFPGETDENFAELLEWLSEAQLDRVGCFRYEPVDGAAANDLAAAVPNDIKEQRWHRLMQHQQAISHKRLKRRVGNRENVIIDEVGPHGAKGRSKGDAPQSVGEIATVRIDRAEVYDLHGTAVGY